MSENPGTDPTSDTQAGESYHGYSVDDEDQPQGEGDSLTDNRGLAEPLDEGYSPPEKWSAGQGWGATPLEEELGETIDQRLPQEVPEPDPYAQAENEPLRGEQGDIIDDQPDGEVGDERSGRLVAQDEGVREDTEKDLAAEDIGIDGAGASAEEGAVHIVDQDEIT
ncbi:DUF5709 domain-containing protein [Nocardioides allogilvus]|uniref:DUF5709 domain-containing protein n=1 Tax=Nocardioides allogilvus TaxID=2072017 RepID=UPI000D309DE5|nr:DUF5709 domain-containing protein [Nocardioides allogilvus]